MKNSKEIFEALQLLENERGIPVDFMFEKIKKAIITACKNSYNGNEDIVININQKKNILDIFIKKTAVEDVCDKGKEISFCDARVINKDITLGEKVAVKLDTKEFGRIAAQTARNIIRQGIRDGERDQVMIEFQSKQKNIVSAVVEKIDQKSLAATVKIGRAETVLIKNEQVGIEKLKEGDHVKVYIIDVKSTEKGPKVIISRTHPDFVKKLFEMEVPEISEGIVEIKSVSREAGARSKIAVLSKDKNIAAIGACNGNTGIRVANGGRAPGGEKIDIIEYDENPEKFIAASLAPSDANNVTILKNDDEEKMCKVTVPDHQLSLAIGNKGQNVRLAAKLTGFKIDIEPESGFFENDK